MQTVVFICHTGVPHALMSDLHKVIKCNWLSIRNRVDTFCQRDSRSRFLQLVFLWCVLWLNDTSYNKWTFRHFDVSPPIVDVLPPGQFATRTIRTLDVSPPGCFAPWTFRPHVMDDSPPNSTTHWKLSSKVYFCGYATRVLKSVSRLTTI